MTGRIRLMLAAAAVFVVGLAVSTAGGSASASGLLGLSVPSVTLPSVTLPSLSSVSCPICVSFVTTYKPGGGQSPVTEMHSNLLVDVPYAIDVHGSAPDLPIGLLSGLPVSALSSIPASLGYDLVVEVEATNSSTPDITIQRISTLPKLPVSVELVEASGSGYESFGYDATSSNAPADFTADLNLTDTDNNPNTSNAAVSVSMTQPSSPLSILEDTFDGNPAGVRTNEAVNELTLSGDGKATTVPTQLSLSVAASTTAQQVDLTHNDATAANFLISSPTGSVSTGSFDLLPESVDLGLADVDLNGDGTLDKQIDYVASAAVPNATVDTSNSGQTTKLAVTDLPATAHLKYFSEPDAAGLAAGHPDQTKVVYNASSVATKAVVTAVSGGRTLTATVDGVPANINELSYTRQADGGVMNYVADGRATDATIDVTDAAASGQTAPHDTATITNVPAKANISYSTSATGGSANYTASDTTDQVAVSLLDGEGQQTSIDATGIPKQFGVTFAKVPTDANGNGSFDAKYTASGVLGHFEVHGRNYQSLPKSANAFDLVLDSVPTTVEVNEQTTASSVTAQPFVLHEPSDEQACDPLKAGLTNCTQCAASTTCTTDNTIDGQHETTDSTQTISVSTDGSGALGHATADLTAGPTTALPAKTSFGRPIDGVIYSDMPGAFEAYARVTDFKDFTYTSDDQSVLGRVYKVSDPTGPDGTTGAFGSSGTSTSNKTEITLDGTGSADALEWQINKQANALASKQVVGGTLLSTPTHIDLLEQTQTGVGSTWTGLGNYYDYTLPFDTFSKATWNASSAVPYQSFADGFPVAGSFPGAVQEPGFSLTEDDTPPPTIELGHLTTPSPNLQTTVQMSTMPTNFTECKSASATCSNGTFDQALSDFENGGPYDPGEPDCLPGPCDDAQAESTRSSAPHEFGLKPGEADQALLLDTSSPTDFTYHSQDPDTTAPDADVYQDISLVGMQHFNLQDISFPNGALNALLPWFNSNKTAFIGIDTDGLPLSGHVETGGSADGPTIMQFAPGFSASEFGWAGEKYSDVAGHVATVGRITCPDVAQQPNGTLFYFDGDDQSQRICDGSVEGADSNDEFSTLEFITQQIVQAIDNNLWPNPQPPAHEAIDPF